MSAMRSAYRQELPADKSKATALLDSIVWAILLIWVGVAMLAEFSRGWFMLGVGALILAAQLARWLMGLRLEGFWAACGVAFVAGGAWTILDLPWPLTPMLFIALGAALLAKAVADARRAAR